MLPFTIFSTSASSVRSPRKSPDKDGQPFTTQLTIKSHKSLKEGKKLGEEKMGQALYNTGNGGDSTDNSKEPAP
jgi:hypothetical protein